MHSVAHSLVGKTYMTAPIILKLLKPGPAGQRTEQQKIRSMNSTKQQEKIMPRRQILSGPYQGSPFRFYCSEISFFDQNLTFIFLNLKPKSPTFRTEIRFPVSSGNGKKYRNFDLSDRNGKPCAQLEHPPAGHARGENVFLPKERVCHVRRCLI